MKLYYSPGACSMAPHIALRETGLDFELERVDLKTRTTESGRDFKEINPKGYVPFLELGDGDSLSEAQVILQYISEQAGGKLFPEGRARWHAREMLNFIATELHKGISPLWKPDTPEAYKDTVLKVLEGKFAYLDGLLADREFLLGEEFTIADAYAYTVLGWTWPLKIDISGYGNLSAYMKRIRDRPKVREAMKREGLIK
jgi:glutathione S-transferase